MRADHLKPNVIVRGPIFPEPVQVITTTPMGDSVKLVGKGLNTSQLYDPILDLKQLEKLVASPEKEPFDGDPMKFRLGIEALRLGLAYEYDPYFSLSIGLLINRLMQDGEVEESVSPNFLVRKWPPAFVEWSTKSVRDIFFASPQFPRLLDTEGIKQTIVRGVANGIIAYVGKADKGKYEPFYFEEQLEVSDIEISDSMFIIKGEEAKKHTEPPKLTSIALNPSEVGLEMGKKQTFVAKGVDQHGREIPVSNIQWKSTGGTIEPDGVFCAGRDEGNFIVTANSGVVTGTANVTIAAKGKPQPPVIVKPEVEAGALSWSGEIPPQKWMNFYTRVVSKFASDKGLKLKVTIEASPEAGISKQKIEETKVALRELGLDDHIRTEEDNPKSD